MKSRQSININGRTIGEQEPPYVIAELSANHNGSLDIALETIAAAKNAGADAVKIQSYEPQTITLDVATKDFQITSGLWKGSTLFELYSRAYTPFDWHPKLFKYAKEIGITLFSSPFDHTAIDLLEGLSSPAYKIASFELVDLPLIERAAKTGRPLVMSTGMADRNEIDEAVDAATKAGCSEMVILHCISGYPTPLDQANLKVITDLKHRYSCIVGLSDHTVGNMASTVSVALGADVIEKHLILDRSLGGPDASFSIEPDELKSLISDVNLAKSSLGRVDYSLKKSESDNVKFRRSLYFVNDLKQGAVIKEHDVKSVRPGFGLAPKYLDDVIGKTVNTSVNRGDATDWKLIDR